jgi:tetratricopeptide (TPR) repeat protein
LGLPPDRDWPGAIAKLESARAVWDTRPGWSSATQLVFLYPLLAEGCERVGRSADADAMLAAIPADVYEGWRARGRIAALRKDYAAADKAYAEAVRQAPSIPRAYLDWGDMLAARGDFDAAVKKYSEANRRGPTWADPLKAWGDVLAKQDHIKQAIAKYDEALLHAPEWLALKTAREAAQKGTR